MKYFVFIILSCFTLVDAKNNHLHDAHQAYSKGDFLKLSKSLKKVFETSPKNSPKVSNAQCLLSEVFNFLQKTPLPVEFQLPSWLNDIHLKSSITHINNKVSNYIEVKGLIDSDAIINRLELIEYPSRRILDSKDRNSTFKVVAINQKQSQFTFKKILNKALKDGLYYINMYSDKKPSLKGWVILKNPSKKIVSHTKASKTLKGVKVNKKKRASIFDVAPCPNSPFKKSMSLQLVKPKYHSGSFKNNKSKQSYGVNHSVKSVYQFGPIGVEFEFIK
ncbi:MAG: hypothetical protein COB02_07665 [Candidatus Cloacimonadota bacterium]|nr:MAG: hypothetical protein COB02_07665 [Candidatus Cloacimonadota bacterium]